MRAACYLRVSRSDQSSALQADATSALIANRGWQLDRVFRDDGASGATANRAAFRALRDAARRREFDVLVVYRSDRLFRSLREFVVLIEELRELGIAYVSCTEPFDTSTSAGRLLLNLVGSFAEFERDVLRERTLAGMEAARLRGARIGRRRCQLDVMRAVTLYESGLPRAAIAKELGISESTLGRALRAELAPAAAPTAPATTSVA